MYPDDYSFLHMSSTGDGEGFEVIGANRARKRGLAICGIFGKVETYSYRGFSLAWLVSFTLEKCKSEVLHSNLSGLERSLQSVCDLAAKGKELSEERQLQTLKHARVIGATTAGAAKVQRLLAYRGVDVVIAEEVGEVLETHMLTSISQTISPTKHSVIIGDHKQAVAKS